MRKVVIGVCLLSLFFYILIITIGDEFECVGLSRTRRSYQYDFVNLKVIRGDYVAYTCQVGRRVYLMDREGGLYLLPEQIIGVWYVGAFREDSFVYYRHCWGVVEEVRHYWKTGEEVIQYYWQEHSYREEGDC